MAKKRSRIKSQGAAIPLVINNTDLLFEIFLRLPGKSLIRFKLVSKSWLSLISDTQFCITHTRRNIIKSSVSDCYYQGYREKIIISFHGRSSFPAMSCLDPYQQNDPEIVHSCNGLILLRHGFFKYGLYQQSMDWDLIVFNPTTQKYRLLVIPSDYLPYKLGLMIYSQSTFLAFEPLKSHHYKVVLMFIKHSSIDHCCVIIYSSQNESWNKISITANHVNRCTRRIYWNGAIHWLNKDNFHLQLDVDAEKLIKTLLPPKPKILGEDNNQYFGESKGRLFLIQCRRVGSPGFQMLELDMKTHSWSIKHQINLRPLALQFPLMHQNTGLKMFEYSVLYVKSGDDMKSFSLVLTIPGTKIAMYEMRKGKRHTNTTNVLCEFPPSCFVKDHECVHPLVQCLAPV